MSSTPDPACYVRIRDLRFRYPGMAQDALWMPSLDVERPGLIAVTGPSGAGKSTLIELLAGTLSERYSGSVQVLGKEWSELRGDRARQFHLRRIALIPQDLGLLPSQTPRQMLLQALLDADVTRNACDDRIMAALTQMELQAYADRRIAELSGGQKQRVAIARALARNVELILADEPTASLHSQLADEAVAVLRRIGGTIPVMMVTHDPRIAQMCDRQVALVVPGPGRAPARTAVAAPIRAAQTVLPLSAAASLPAVASAAASLPAPVPMSPAASALPIPIPVPAAAPQAAHPRTMKAPPAPRALPTKAAALPPALPAAAPAPPVNRPPTAPAAPPVNRPPASPAALRSARALPLTLPVPTAARLATTRVLPPPIAPTRPVTVGRAAARASRERRAIPRHAVAASVAACGLAAVVGLFVANPMSSPSADQRPVAAPTHPAASPVPPAPPAPAVVAASAPRAPAGTVTQAAARIATVPRPPARPTPKPAAAPAVQAAAAQPAPAPAPAPSAVIVQPSPTPMAAPNYLQWWQSLAQAFMPRAGLPAPQPSATP